MKILVLGGTGTVGSQVVRDLVARLENVQVLTRSAEKSRALPAGASGRVGDLGNPSTLPAAFEGIESVFLLTAVGEHETEEGLAAVEAAKSAGVRRIVFMSVHNLEAGLQIPHFQSKVPIEKAIQASGLDFTILRPNNFYQNDFWFRDPVVKYGVYPQPIGSVGLSRVDVRDIAEVAVSALTELGHNGATYPLVGPDVWTGEKTAALYARYLGRNIRYGGDDLDAWFAQARTMMPLKQAEDLRIMYDHFQKRGLLASKSDFDKQQRVLRHPPRSFEAFVAENAPAWKSKAATSK